VKLEEKPKKTIQQGYETGGKKIRGKRGV